MTSRTHISNLALNKIGQPPITDIDDGLLESNRMLLVFDDVVDEVTKSRFWVRVKKRVELAKLEETPLYGFNFQFQLPPDALRVIAINEIASVTTPFKIEGTKLLYDLSTVSINYIERQDDPTLWGDGLKNAIVWRLAAEVAYIFTSSVTLTESLYARYDEVNKKESSIDSRQGSRPKYHSGDTLRDR